MKYSILFKCLGIFLLLQAMHVSAAVVTHSGTISSREVWSSDDVHVIDSSVTLAAGVELIIEAGAIVKFTDRAQLTINGALNAEGALGEEIIFTSIADDSAGGDTNGDGYSTGAPADWRHIVFNDAVSDALTVFSHVKIRFPGSSGQGIYISGADITLDNVLVEESQGYGLFLTNSAAVINNSTVRNNNGHGVYLTYGAPLIENSVISDNRGSGIYSQYSTPEIVGNTIENNDSWGIYFYANYITADLTDNTIRHNARPARIPVSALDGASNNIFAPNDIDGLFVIGGTASSGLNLSLEQYADGSELNTYVITSDMTIPSGQAFTVDAGVTTKFYTGAELRISGEFQSLATTQNPSVFTAYRDDRFGGDTNNDGYNSTPYNGYWDGIRFYDSAVDHASTIDHLKIHYAGGTSSGALYFNRTLQSLNNVEIAFSGSEGVYCNYYCELEINNSDFYGNTDGVEVDYYSSVEINGGRIYANRDDGIDVRSNSSVSTSTGFEIFGNSANAVRSDAAVSLDNVWWGAEDGPSGAGSGSGDSITANVSYADVRGSGTGFLYFNAGANTTKGTFGVVDVLNGTATSEWGSSAAQQSLYGFENIELAVSGLSDTYRYQLISTLYNPDETASSGGNIQRLEDIDGTPLEPRVKLDDALLSSEFWLPENSISEGTLALRWVKENGYRAVISQLWVLAEPIPAGNDLTVTIASPASGETVGTETTLSGSVTSSSVIDRAYLTITAPTGTVELQPLDSIQDDGAWTFRWQPQTSGSYTITLHAEAADGQSARTGIYSYNVDLEKPASASNFYAFDTPEDNGGSISLLWSRSTSTDVVTYQVHRSLTGNDGSYTLLASLDTEISNYSDTDAITGTNYYYRLDAVDGVGFSASAYYGPVVAFDNTLPDSAAPEDVSGLSATAGDGTVSLAWDLSENTAGDQVDQWLDISIDGGVSWGTNSPSFDNGAYQSLGLLKNQILVEDLTNGQGYQFRIRTADGASPVNISSGAISAEVTPAANAVVEVSGSLTRSTRWSSGVYHVTSNLTIDAGVTLTVDPGVVIKFSPRTTLTVNGTLDVQGNDSERVTFTAYGDDSVGGDTNNDGASSGERNSWGYIRVNASGSVSLNYADIYYAGYGSQYSLYVYQTNADINSSRIAHGNGGVYLYQSSGSLINNEIYDHDQSGLKVYSGTSTIAQVEIFGNHIHNNAHGVTTSYSNVDFYIEDNVIENNSGTGLDIDSGINVVSFRGNEITNNNLAVKIPFAALPDKSDNNILTPNTRPVIEVLAGSLSRSVIFDPTVAGALYITGNATIASGGQLVFKPGSVVKFTSNGRLTNSGALSVQGEADDRVVFTSYRDDSVGGDSNGDGLSQGQPGDWNYLYFGDSTTDSLSTLAYVDVRFAGSGGQGVRISRADITLDNVLVEESEGYGLYIENSAAVISNSTVRNNNSHGVYLTNGAPLIESSVISDNRGSGIYSQYSTPEIVGNTIENNDSWGIYFYANYITADLTDNTIRHNVRPARIPVSALDGASNNIFAPNDIDGLFVIGGTASSGLNLSLEQYADGSELNTYVITSDITIPSGQAFTVDAGVTTKFYTGAELRISGEFQSLATEQSPAVFTAYRDDRFGGDTNSDGYNSTPYNGYWDGIRFYDSAVDHASTIDHLKIHYAGGTSNGALYFNRTLQSLNNVEIAFSGSEGVYCNYYCELEINNSDFYGNTDGVEADYYSSVEINGGRIYANRDDGIDVRSNSSVSTSTGFEIFGNSAHAVRSDAAVSLDNVWWGAEDGPSGAGSGSGDSITANVSYADVRVDGSEYASYYASSTDNPSYGLIPPIISGSVSTEWGESDFNTVVYSNPGEPLTVQYSGLDPAYNYQLIASFYRGEEIDAVQVAESVSGSLYPKIVFADDASQIFVPINRDDIVDSNYEFSISSPLGERAFLSGLFLIKNGSAIDSVAVDLSAPEDLSTVSAGHIDITGTVEPRDVDSVVVTVTNGADRFSRQANIKTNGSWSLRWQPLVNGDHTIIATAVIDGTVVAQSAPVVVTADTDAPAAVQAVTAESQNSVAVLLWDAVGDDGDATSYIIERTETAGDYEVLTTVPSTQIKYTDTAVAVGQTYTYRVSATDLAGNTGAPTTSNPVTVTDDASGDSTPDVDALSVQLLGSEPEFTGFITWALEGDSFSTVEAYRVYVKAPGDTTFNLHETKVRHEKYSYLTGLLASETVEIKVTVIDIYGNESDGVVVSATPQSDSHYTATIDGDLDSALNLQAGVYHIPGNFQVLAGGYLKAQPGVVIKMAYRASLTVKGRLEFVGAEDNKVVITSYKDDSFGGDTNNDGLSSGEAGDWSSIIVSGGDASFDHTQILYSGYNQAAVNLQSGSLSLENSTITESLNIGVLLAGGDAQVVNSFIVGNHQDGLSVTGADSAPVISGNEVTGNGRYGLYVRGAQIVVTENIISQNASYGVYYSTSGMKSPVAFENNVITGNAYSVAMPASAMMGENNTLTPNSGNFVKLWGEDLNGELILSTLAQGQPEELSTYIISGSTLEVPASSRLSVTEGVVLKFTANHGGILAGGELDLLGTESAPVVLTSIADDAWYGDHNSDGYASVPQRGDWQGVRVRDSFASTFSDIRHAQIHYAGSNNSYGALDIRETDLSIEALEVSNSASSGLTLYNSSSSVIGSSFWGNSEYGVRINSTQSEPVITFSEISNNHVAGVAVENGSARLTNNRIFANTTGISNQSAAVIDATNVWWGSNSGPVDPSNPTRPGDSISGAVDYEPFQSNVEFDYTYVNFTEAGLVLREGDSGFIPELTQGTLSDDWGTNDPGRTMVWDSEQIQFSLSNLNPAKDYKLRLTYFNGDSVPSTTSLQTTGDIEVHTARVAPSEEPTSYEFSLTQNQYLDGVLDLSFVHESPQTTLRTSISELVLLEAEEDLTPARLISVQFNDIDGTGSYSSGDQLRFIFSEAMDTESAATLGELLILAEELSFGSTDSYQWSNDQKTLKVSLTSGYTVAGGETVSPGSVLDVSGNPAVGSYQLPTVDTVSPTLVAIEWTDEDGSGQLSVGDTYKFVFDEVMDISRIVSGTTNANARLSVIGGYRYGDVNTTRWEDGNSAVIVELTEGFTLSGGEIAEPSSFVTDVAGNPVQGRGELVGTDTTAPQFTAVRFNDVDGSGDVSRGDKYTFVFSEAIKRSALSDNTTEANANLSPEGQLWGSLNTINCNIAATECEVTITDGYTVTGNEVVSASEFLTDRAGNEFSNTITLNLNDVVAPVVTSVTGSVGSPVPVTAEYRVTVRFDSSMDVQQQPVISLLGENGETLALEGGEWATTQFDNDTFISPVIELDETDAGRTDIYVSGGRDVAGNSLNASSESQLSYYIQPLAPQLTFPALMVAPEVNLAVETSINLSGSRQANTSVWVNETLISAAGDAGWNSTLQLSQGMNTLSLYVKNASNTESERTTYQIFVDSVAPVVTGVTPLTGTVTNVAPAEILISVNESGAGIDPAASSLTVTGSNGVIPGAATFTAQSGKFTPGLSFLADSYTISADIYDRNGNQAAPFVATFTVDKTPPAAPVITSAPAISRAAQVEISGSKEVGSSLLLNGELISTDTAENWTVMAPLAPGDNTLLFAARDAAGNTGSSAEVSVVYDDIAPGSVAITGTDPGTGRHYDLDWTAYNELSNGADIASYQVYIAGQAFDSSAQANLIALLPGREKTYRLGNLQPQETYYVAVVAVDASGNSSPIEHVLSVTPEDNEAPAEVEILSIESRENSVVIGWRAVADVDLDNYLLSVDGGDVAELASDVTEYEITGLNNASLYSVLIQTRDTSGNTSDGAGLQVATLLTNPVIDSTEAFSGKVNLTWTPVEPSDALGAYVVYAQPADFADVSGLTPKLTVSKDTLQAAIAGLSNGQEYHIAVAAVNISEGVDPLVTTISVTPEADNTGPEIGAVVYGDNAIDSLASLSVSDVISATVTDPSLVGRVEFYIDDILVGTDSYRNDGFSLPLDLYLIDDGAHQLTLKAFDTFENMTEESFSINVALQAPAAPEITSPQTGLVTNRSEITVEGHAAKHTDVQLLVDGVNQGEPVSTDSSGNFRARIVLNEGSNSISAQAQFTGRTAAGNAAASVEVTLDSSIPATPFGLQASAGELGVVSLSWSRLADVDGYLIYRAGGKADFEQATVLTPSPIDRLTYSDTPAQDGEYTYFVTAVNDLGTESLPSEAARATSDSVPPFVTEIQYENDGVLDPETDIAGPGVVTVSVRFSEPLLTKPYFALVPDNGVPSSIILTKNYSDDTLYSGQWQVSDALPDGLVYAVLSAYDKAGNRGSDIEAGASIRVDTHGPAAQSILINPGSPIDNNPDENGLYTRVQVRVTLTEEPEYGTTPVLVPVVGEEVIDVYSDGIELFRESGNDATPLYVGSIDLPATAGMNDQGDPIAEILRFTFSAVDELGNISEDIEGNNAFQVYQGELPPLGAPLGLKAEAKANGSVMLSWLPVDGNAGFAIYRRTTSETDYTHVATTQPDAESYSDQGLLDGTYEYAVATVRSENGAITESTLSDPVTVTSDATRPEAPQEFTLELNGAGIVATWNAETTQEVIRFNLYRLALGEDDSVDLTGVEPLQTNIPETIALDTQPSLTEHLYVVTAVDPAGNESDPSNSAYLNPELLPVASLRVDLPADGYPEVSWSHPSVTVQGYELFSGPSGNLLKAHTDLLTSGDFIDELYNPEVDGGSLVTEQTYEVIAVDDNGVKSIPSSVSLPVLSVALSSKDVQGQSVDNGIYRGVMNRLWFKVENKGTQDWNRISLAVTLTDDRDVVHTHESEAFDILSGDEAIIPVVVGGYRDLSGQVELQITLSKNAGQKTWSVSEEVTAAIADAALVTTLNTRNFVRGAEGELSFTIENTSDVNSEFILAKNFGNAKSSEIRILVLDDDGNTLASAPVQQTADGVLALANGDVVARVEPGERWTSTWFNVPVPVSAGDELLVRLQVDQMHYDLGKATHVAIKGTSASKTVELIDVPYRATISSITPDVITATGDTQVSISGSVTDSSTDSLMAETPIDLVLKSAGFERVLDILTDQQGNFTYTFTPAASDAGSYTISAVYPGSTERPDMGNFEVYGYRVTPDSFNGSLSRNIEEVIPVTVRSYGETALTGVTVQLLPEDQDTGEIPAGITLTSADVVELSPGSSRKVNFRVVGNNNADQWGEFNIRVVAAEQPEPIAVIPVTYSLQAARAGFDASPRRLDVGLRQEESLNETIEITNPGQIDLDNVRLTIVDSIGVSDPYSWIFISSATSYSSLAAGASESVDISIAPGVGVINSDYRYYLKVESDNYQEVQIPLDITVSNADDGDLFFHVSDIFTATRDEQGQTILGLQGASISLQNEQVYSEVFTSRTDQNGDAFFENIPVGSYWYRVTAPDHTDQAGRIWVQPDTIKSQEVFLMNELVTVEWNVEEITIEDRYEITLEATYATNVPVAVLALEPKYISLPNLQEGEQFLGEMTLTNYGLVRAESMNANFPESNEYAQFEFMVDVPETLEAGEVLTIPYRITALRDFDGGLESSASGAGCSSGFNEDASVSGSSPCPNGTNQPVSDGSRFGHSPSLSCGGSGEQGERQTYGGSGGGGGLWGYGGGSTDDGLQISPMPCRDPGDDCGGNGGG